MCTPTNSRTHDPKRSRPLEANTLQPHLFGLPKNTEEILLNSISRTPNDTNEALRWVDTIQVYFRQSLPESVYKSWGPKTEPHWSKSGKKSVDFKYVLPVRLGNGAIVFLMYREHSLLGCPMLWIKFSVPKVIQGNNYAYIPQGTDIVAKLNKMLHNLPDIPKLDIQDGFISIIHIAVNIYLENGVSDAIQVLRDRSMHCRTRGPYENYDESNKRNSDLDNGITWKNKSGKRTSVYDKMKQCGCKEARNILRFEDAFEHSKTVKSLLDSSRPCTIADLYVGLFVGKLNEDLKILGLNVKTPTNKDDVLERLKKKCKTPRRANLLYGIWRTMADNPNCSIDQLVEKMGISVDAFYKYKREITAAGIGGNGIAKKALPAFVVTADTLDKNVNKVHNDIVVLPKLTIFNPKDIYKDLSTDIIWSHKMLAPIFNGNFHANHLDGVAPFGIQPSGLVVPTFNQKCDKNYAMTKNRKFGQGDSFDERTLRWMVTKSGKSTLSGAKIGINLLEDYQWPTVDTGQFDDAGGPVIASGRSISSLGLSVPDQASSISSGVNWNPMIKSILRRIPDRQSGNRLSPIDWLLHAYQSGKISLAYLLILLALTKLPMQPLVSDLAEQQQRFRRSS